MEPKKILILVGAVLVLMVIFALGGLYVGGVAFVHLENLPDTQAGLFTLVDYWHAYSDVLKVKRVLVLCNVIAVLITLIPAAMTAVVVATIGRRALHGDARFARASEIRRAGLTGE
ncbi:hypothetical protein PSP6_690032 [Paraburkholderia tropica]|uniref:hypothetical protein n=1 Tax=Paraburkholderia tropica TaxID=92647 RepID=UPI001CAB8FDD|nr:hypothetical protein [Paraburkholderia tropica]CAG9235677.1 hypothetical protein PSP6_690032 [Paraburkholderia tropica]